MKSKALPTVGSAMEHGLRMSGKAKRNSWIFRIDVEGDVCHYFASRLHPSTIRIIDGQRLLSDHEKVTAVVLVARVVAEA